MTTMPRALRPLAVLALSLLAGRAPARPLVRRAAGVLRARRSRAPARRRARGPARAGGAVQADAGPLPRRAQGPGRPVQERDRMARERDPPRLGRGRLQGGAAALQ